LTEDQSPKNEKPSEINLLDFDIVPAVPKENGLRDISNMGLNKANSANAPICKRI